MNVGTKSVLFGVHQFLLHPFFVFISWYRFYGEAPSFKECICIFFHDVGYLFKPNMDGKEGELHPELGGKIVNHILGGEYSDITLYHSRSYARKFRKEISKLCMPDKLSILLYPTWLYLVLGTLSGEISEYKHRMQMSNLSDKEWLLEIRFLAYCWTHSNCTYQQQFVISSVFFDSNTKNICN
jgi:hypothetical protein